jgi:hypothetical protein
MICFIKTTVLMTSPCSTRTRTSKSLRSELANMITNMESELVALLLIHCTASRTLQQDKRLLDEIVADV